VFKGGQHSAKAVRVILLMAPLLGLSACDDEKECPQSCDCDGGTSDIQCSSEPEECSDIGATEEEQYFGCCFFVSVYWCTDGELESIDCGASGYSCAYNPEEDYVDCED
jgi:hypothetical protein